MLTFNDCALPGFLYFFYNPDGTMKTNNAHPVGFSEALTFISFEEFVARGSISSNNIRIDDALSSVGVFNNLDEFIVPGWFINAPVVISSPPERPFNVPLNITNVKKGDYLVHRDHGVGICMGLHKYNGDVGQIRNLFL